MKLGTILQHIRYEHFSGDPEVVLGGIAYDSRKVKEGDLFVAIKGSTSDGHLFLEEAVRKGAAAVAVEDEKKCPDEIPCIRVADTREALSQIAVQYYGRPFEGMNLIGITGTNGKTTVAYLLESILSSGGKRVGVIGTINYRLPGEQFQAPVTTPESLDLMRIMRRMADAGVTEVVMEVSSHALDQGRIRGCPFGMAVFTNLSRDHLDYHGTREAYFAAKSTLFTSLKQGRTGQQPAAIINMDDPWGAPLKERTTAKVVTYGLAEECDVRALDVKVGIDGIGARLKTPAGDAVVRSSLMGDFNVYNIMAAVAAAVTFGVKIDVIASGIEALKGVPGRLERVKNRAGKSIVVDYAHTPDALEKALHAVRPYAKEKLVCVFGCGGDRDKGKRKEMGRLAAQLSDVVVLTSDNPRSEDPEAIISQIEEGVRLTGIPRHPESSLESLPSTGYVIMPDRAEAIQTAVRLATERDLVLIAGKGHETYQIVGREVRDFDDREVASQALS